MGHIHKTTFATNSPHPQKLVFWEKVVKKFSKQFFAFLGLFLFDFIRGFKRWLNHLSGEAVCPLPWHVGNDLGLPPDWPDVGED